MSTDGPPSHAFGAYDPRLARVRLLAAAVAAASTAWLIPASFGWAMRTVVGWDAGAAVLIGIAWTIIVRSNAAETRRRAAAEDPGRTLVWVLVLLTSAISLFAAVGVLRHVKSLAPEASDVLTVACIGAVASAWVLTHTGFTLRYAHLYYRDDEDAGGLVFPGDEPPDDFDFAYFAFTVGMCFQVSDVTVSSSSLRRIVLIHSVISFAYNTAIIALAMNLVVGVLG